MGYLYTAYHWRSDDEGGIGICKYGEWTPSKGYYPESGPWARPSVKIGDFNTATELANLLMADNPEWWTYETAMQEAKELIEWYKDEDCWYP